MVIAKLRNEWERCSYYFGALGIEDTLVEHVQLERRWLLDGWLRSLRKLDECFESLDGEEFLDDLDLNREENISRPPSTPW